jgi:signal transduction histidine kinase
MISVHDFFYLNRQLILFIYGLGFFILGFAILLQAQRSSRLELARSLFWLAAFGITHAFNEWGDLFIPIQAQYLSVPLIRMLEVVQLILLAFSFTALFQFGISVLSPFNLPRAWQSLPGVLLAWWTIVTFFAVLPLQPEMEEWHHTSSALARYFICLPGGLLAAYGLRLHAIKRIRPLNVPVIYSTLRIAGISIGIYAILAGLVPPPVHFFPGNILNTVTFEQAVGVPIIIFRTVVCLVIAASVIRSLEIFTVESQRTIEELEQQQIIYSEHERLARELHDGAIQKVYTAGLLVESASRLAESGSEVGSRLQRAAVVLNDAIADLRYNLSELHHPETFPADETVAQLLENLAQNPHYNTLVNISIDLQIPAGRALSPMRTHHLHAILNEAFANIVRHARARSVSLGAQDFGERFKIWIKDDGIGFSPGTRQGYGLRNMRDRTRLLNGEIQFSDSSSKGTTVTLLIPWEDK